MGLDLGDVIGVADPKEPLGDLGRRDLPPELPEDPYLDLDREVLGVHEDAVAVEDDELSGPRAQLAQSKTLTDRIGGR